MPQDCIILAKQCLTQKNYEIFLKTGEIDVSFAIPGISRFRVNVFKQRGTCAIVFRRISNTIPDIKDIGVPMIVSELVNKKRGLIIVTGPTGSGKTTTLASLINKINVERGEHIVTIEDPIEYTYPHKKSLINQREVGVDTMSFSNALRGALREDPDIILVGEMRDQETMATVLAAAETGHLVLSTLHTLGAAKTIDRIIDTFNPYQQNQVRSQLSTVLVSIISQQLILKKDLSERVLATELLINTPAIANLIRESKTAQISTCIHTGGEFGMYTMDHCLVGLYKDEVIDLNTVFSHCVDYENTKKILGF
jgi:twitching motility protein PilT